MSQVLQVLIVYNIPDFEFFFQGHQYLSSCNVYYRNVELQLMMDMLNMVGTTKHTMSLRHLVQQAQPVELLVHPEEF